VTPPAHGVLSGSGPTFTYTPAQDYNGPDSITFKVNDGSHDSNTSTVNITITEVNDAPVATDDAASANEDSHADLSAIDFAANDSTGPADESLQLLTVTSVSATANTHGTVSLANGIVTYTPDANFNGAASFEYQVCDNGNTNGSPDSKCATGVVNVTVNPVNDAPGANSQSVTTNSNTPVTITLSGNDLETADLVFEVTATPAHGSLAGMGANLTYTPNANYSGPDSFQFTVRDAGDGSATALTSAAATVSITVNDTVAPVINAPGNVRRRCDDVRRDRNRSTTGNSHGNRQRRQHQHRAQRRAGRQCLPRRNNNHYLHRDGRRRKFINFDADRHSNR
jgi:hypothetical protein